MKAVVALSLLACNLLAKSQTVQPDCDMHLESLRQAYLTTYRSGAEDWADLEPLVNRVHTCFGDARTAAHADVFDYESSILIRQRRFGDAVDTIERFLRDYASVATPDVTARIIIRRGYIYDRLGWTAEMLADFTRAAAMADRLSPPLAVRTLRDAAEYYRMVNDLETARQYLRAAESMVGPLYEEDPATHGPELGVIRSLLGLVLLNEGERGIRSEQEAAEEAIPLFESALALIPATPPNAFQRAHALLRLSLAHRMAEMPEAALPLVTEAHSFSSWYRDSYPQVTIDVRSAEARTHFLLGHFEEAKHAYEATLELAIEAGEREEALGALLGLGETAEAEATRSNPDGLRRAEAYFREAATLAEEIRRTYGTHDWSASAWEVIQQPYHHLVRVLLRQGRAAEAFLALDATRARHLRDLRTATRLRATLDVQSAARLDSLSDALSDVRSALRDTGLPVAEHSALETQEIALQQEVDHLLGQPDYTRTPLTIEAVQRALQPRDRVLLTYFLDRSYPTAFVVRADTFAVVPLHVQHDALQDQIRNLGWFQQDEGGSLDGFPLTPLHALYEVLYAPVAALVPAEAPLVVVPDPPLDQIPFGLLLERAHPPFDYADAPYLLRHHPITVELAASLLTETEEATASAPAPAPPLDFLALGRSRFASSSPEGLQLQHLPNVAEELRRLRRHPGNARFALNEEATEAYFDAHRNDTRVIHLASHAFVNPQLPLYSRILLWDDPAQDDDGILHLYELYDRPLNAALVTLSGCSTARGRRHIGEGMMGLQYAFRAAGARATLATLWRVDDAATGEFMDSFYEHLWKGLPIDEALQQVQLTYLAEHDGRRASPFYWGAPVLYGDPAPVPITGRARSAMLWVPLGLVLLLAGLALPRAVLYMRARRSEDG